MVAMIDDYLKSDLHSDDPVNYFHAQWEGDDSCSYFWLNGSYGWLIFKERFQYLGDYD